MAENLSNLPTEKIRSKSFPAPFENGCTKVVVCQTLDLSNSSSKKELTTAQIPARKPFRTIDYFSKYNLKKLSILLFLFDNPQPLSEIIKAIPPGNKTKKQHYQSISVRVTKLRRKYTHPYIKHDIRKGQFRYMLTVKGKRIACELYFRMRNKLTMHIVKKYFTRCHRPCETCKWNPKIGSYYTTVEKRG